MFARPQHLLLATMTLYCGGQLYYQDSIPLRFRQTTLSVKSIVEETHVDCLPPLVVETFLQKPVCVHSCLGKKLAVANTLLGQQGFSQASQLGVHRITGFRPGQTSLHGQGMAIDIDAATNPYLIHEHNETTLDEALGVVYERIAQFILGHASVLPHLGERGQLPEARRTYVARLYMSLAQESAAMQRYFLLMQDGLQLRAYVQTPLGSRRVRQPNTFLTLVLSETNNSPQAPDSITTIVSNRLIDQIRLRMMSDWVTLTGQAGPPILALPPDDARLSSNKEHLPYPPEPYAEAHNPAHREADRPFDTKGNGYSGRSPLRGFLTLRKELVLALIDVGLRWGALDFSRTSGDLMHFDSRDTSCKMNQSGNE